MTNRFGASSLCLALLLAGAAMPSPARAQASDNAAPASDAFDTFVPKADRIEHRIDYSIWTEALSNFVLSMGPPLRRRPFPSTNALGTNLRLGHNSIYRLEGSMVAFSFMNREVIDSFAEYRRDLQSVADTLDIQSIPRNEQLAYWFNLHNVALMEQIAKAWPVRQPREIEIDGVPLDEAKFIMVEGVALSPKDIRTRIVYPHWKDSRVIYGFWRGEIGGPALQREAFDAFTLARLLEAGAREFVSSRRGVEDRGDTLHVSRIYEEAAPFYFPDFEKDLRAHLLTYANQAASEKIGKTNVMEVSLREYDIADLAGGARANAFFSNGRIPAGVALLLRERAEKLQYMERKGLRTGTVIFGDIRLPGDPAGKGEIE